MSPRLLLVAALFVVAATLESSGVRGVTEAAASPAAERPTSEQLQAADTLSAVPSNSSGNSSSHGGGDTSSVPQWETALSAIAGCFGAIFCMLGLKVCTKCYGRLYRACRSNSDSRDGADEDDDGAVVVINSSSKKPKKPKSKPAKGSSGKGGKGYTRVEEDEW